MVIVLTVLTVAALLLAVYCYGRWASAAHRVSNLKATLDTAHEQLNLAEVRRDSAIQQVQDLAQRLASIRIEHGAVPQELERVTAEPPKPYSPELRDFLDGIVHAEARNIVEENIDFYRDQGMADSQILEKISEGEVL